MMTFKTAELKAQQENLYAYTLAPPHHLKSVAASAISFLDDNWTRSPSPIQHTDWCDSRNPVFDGLLVELNGYISEPRVPPYKWVNEGPDATIQWCDPLRYWMVSGHQTLDSPS